MDILNCSGIYKIICQETGKIYIGSSCNVRTRWRDHCYKLNKNNHKNPYLQAAWNKYGSIAFSIELIETVDRCLLIEREQFWVNALQPFGKQGYNIAEVVENPMRGRTHSIETRQKFSLQRKGNTKKKGWKAPPETLEKMRLARLGKQANTETRKRMSETRKGRPAVEPAKIATAEANSEYYIVIDPDGCEFLIKNLSRFCVQNGLSRGSMTKIAFGVIKTHKGWKCRKANETDKERVTS